MSKLSKKKMNEFIALCDNGNEGETDMKPKVVLDRDTIHTITVQSVVEGENQYGSYLGLDNGEGMIFFGGYEASDLKRVIENVETPFTLDILRTQVQSKKNEGRTFNKVHAKLV